MKVTQTVEDVKTKNNVKELNSEKDKRMKMASAKVSLIKLVKVLRRYISLMEETNNNMVINLKGIAISAYRKVIEQLIILIGSLREKEMQKLPKVVVTISKEASKHKYNFIR